MAAPQREHQLALGRGDDARDGIWSCGKKIPYFPWLLLLGPVNLEGNFDLQKGSFPVKGPVLFSENSLLFESFDFFVLQAHSKGTPCFQIYILGVKVGAKGEMVPDDWVLLDINGAEHSVQQQYGPPGVAAFRALLGFQRDGMGKKRSYGLFEEVLPTAKLRVKTNGTLYCKTSGSGTPRLVIKRLSRTSNQFEFVAFYMGNDYATYDAWLKGERRQYDLAASQSGLVPQNVPNYNVCERANGRAFIAAEVAAGRVVWNEVSYAEKPVQIQQNEDV